MMESPGYILTEELTKDPKEKKRITVARGDLDRGIAQAVKEESEEALPFTLETRLLLGKLKQAFEEYYAKLGIEQINWPKHIIRSRHLRDSYNIERIRIKARVEGTAPLLAQAWQEYQEAEKLIHELYHALAPYKLGLEEIRQQDGNLSLRLKDERVGLYYAANKRGSKGVAALEEGMAVRALKIFRPTIDKYLINCAHIHNQIVEQVQQRYPNVPSDLIIADIREDGNFECAISNYLDSYMLAEYLCETVPDFERLAERARMKHETVALARAVENIFGRQSYREIMLADENSAKEVMERLKARIASRKEKK